MRKLAFGLVALAGSLILGMLWLKQHEIKTGVDRLERSELPRTSTSTR